MNFSVGAWWIVPIITIYKNIIGTVVIKILSIPLFEPADNNGWILANYLIKYFTLYYNKSSDKANEFNEPTRAHLIIALCSATDCPSTLLPYPRDIKISIMLLSIWDIVSIIQ